MQTVIRETGALDQLEQLITSLTDEAIEAIGNAPLSQEARNELVELAAFVSWRSV